jgi:hypothetical protein
VSEVRRFVARQPLVAFLFVAYAWSWLVWIPGVGPIRTFWHAPLFYAPFGSFISGAPVTVESVALFLTLVTGLSVLSAWVWRHSGGSVLLTVLMHTVVNVNALTLFFPGSVRVQLEFVYASLGLLWLSILAIVFIDRRSWTEMPTASSASSAV